MWQSIEHFTWHKHNTFCWRLYSLELTSFRFSFTATTEIKIRNQAGKLINLAEVQLYNAGVQIPATQLIFKLSSTYSTYSASNCNDGNLNNFCHSHTTDLNGPTLTITATLPFDLIVVTNRQDSCCRDWIVGATITVTQGGVQQWQSVFSSNQGSYTFPSKWISYTKNRFIGLTNTILFITSCSIIIWI